MNKEQYRQRAEKLKKMIRHHRYLYHVLNRQEIEESVLDSLKHELYQIEQKYPELVTLDSPTQRVGGEPLKKFDKVQHETPMLSIEDVFSEKELKNWNSYLERLAPSDNIDWFCELKIDGFAVTLIYEKGILIRGATRGNGAEGENVTQNLKTIESIPLKLSVCTEISSLKIQKRTEDLIKSGKIEIRGEVYMTKKAFQKINEERQRKGEAVYANPRNIAAGSIRQLDSKLAASRDLNFLAYGIVTDLGQKQHSQEHEILKCLGFAADKNVKECKTLEEITKFWRRINKKRDSFSFQIDGVVVSVNNNILFKKLGVAGKSSRGARAFKFSAKRAATQIEDIRIQIGRTGAATPIAYLRPVNIEGTTISRATLHNADEIQRLGVKIGDTVIIERAGDVIPVVVEALTELRVGGEEKFCMPKVCPICESPLKRPEGEVIWRCLNKDCQAQRKRSLHHFVSKKAFDIDGLGPKVINRLIEENLISQASDLFNLQEGDLMLLERFAEKSVSNLIASIQKSKKISLARFIYAMGIRHIGEGMSINLANYFRAINKLQNASVEELKNIPDIGEKAAISINNWFKSENNRQIVERLLRKGIKIFAPPPIGKKLKGKTFILTGSLKTLTRSGAEKRIRLLGGHPLSSVSKETNYIVTGKNPGSKLAKARQLGIKIIEEKEFLKMISKT